MSFLHNDLVVGEVSRETRDMTLSFAGLCTKESKRVNLQMGRSEAEFFFTSVTDVDFVGTTMKE